MLQGFESYRPEVKSFLLETKESLFIKQEKASLSKKYLFKIDLLGCFVM